jgi:hypothetical protein
LQQAFKLAMKIDKELLEKYHRNQCTAEESDAVEEWLFSEDSEEVLQLPATELKSVHKLEMWDEIAKILPAATLGTSGHQTPPAIDNTSAELNTFSAQPKLLRPAKRTLKMAFWSGAIAASLVTGILVTAVYRFNAKPASATEVVDVNNTSPEKVRHFTSSGYTIAIGTNTSARIDNLTGVVDLSGSILISPKKDVKLSFDGSAEKVLFKKGQTYILLKGKDGKDKILIVDRKNLMDLPPVLQKQITHEFNI